MAYYCTCTLLDWDNGRDVSGDSELESTGTAARAALAIWQLEGHAKTSDLGLTVVRPLLQGRLPRRRGPEAIHWHDEPHTSRQRAWCCAPVESSASIGFAAWQVLLCHRRQSNLFGVPAQFLAYLPVQWKVQGGSRYAAGQATLPVTAAPSWAPASNLPLSTFCC